MIRRNALQAANRDGPVFDSTTSACRFAGAVAHSPQNAGEDIGCSICQIRFAELPLGNQADVMRHVSVRRAGPLAIDNFVIVLGVGGICRFHSKLAPDEFLHPAYSCTLYLPLA